MASLFKITSPDRLIKKAVMADNFQSFMQSACSKLSCPSMNGARAVLEVDGTEIDEWELLLPFNKEIIMILGKNEKYEPRESKLSSMPTKIIEKEAVNAEEQVNPIIVEEQVNPITTAFQETGVANTKEPLFPAEVEKISENVELRRNPTLPKFSDYAEKRLSEGKPMGIISTIVKELAYGLLSKYEMKTQGEYQAVGKLLYAKYPCIHVDRKALTPWQFIINKLSAKIRHIRWLENQKEKSFSQGQQKKRKRKTTDEQPSCSVEIEQEDMSYDDSVIELKNAFEELEKDVPKLFKLIRKTFAKRRKFIMKTTSQFDKIYSEFPHLSDPLYLGAELDLLLNIQNSQTRFRENFEKLSILLDKEYEVDDDQSEFEKTLALIKYLELNLNEVPKGKGSRKDKGKSKKCIPYSIINVIDVKENNLKDAPLLVVKEKDVFLLYKNCNIQLCLPLTDCVYTLVAFYYGFDLSYPGVLLQILGFLQEYILQDNGPKAYFVKTTKYLQFVEEKELNEKLN